MIEMMRNEERRQNNRNVMQETLSLIGKIPELKTSIEESIANMDIFIDGEIPPSVPRYGENAEVIVSRKRSAEAAWAYKDRGRTAILDFASGTNPGGGARSGSNAQEESLCRISTLLPLLESEKAATYYFRNRETTNGMYTDSVILAPDITFFRHDDEKMKVLPEIDWMRADVIVIPAPNLRRTGVPVGNDSRTRYEHILQKRIETIFKTATYSGADILILGAFGCGVFGNNPETVCKMFRKVQQDYFRHFRVIEYAVYARNEDDPNYRAFEKAFKQK